MAGRIARAVAIAASALVGGVIGAGSAFLVTYIVTTEVVGMGEGAMVFTLLSAPVGFIVGSLAFGVGAFWLGRAWSEDEQRAPPRAR